MIGLTSIDPSFCLCLLAKFMISSWTLCHLGHQLEKLEINYSQKLHDSVKHTNTQISNPNLHPNASKQVQEQEFCQNHDHLVDAWKMKHLWFIWNKLELTISHFSSTHQAFEEFNARTNHTFNLPNRQQLWLFIIFSLPKQFYQFKNHDLL